MEPKQNAAHEIRHGIAKSGVATRFVFNYAAMFLRQKLGKSVDFHTFFRGLHSLMSRPWQTAQKKDAIAHCQTE